MTSKKSNTDYCTPDNLPVPGDIIANNLHENFLILDLPKPREWIMFDNDGNLVPEYTVAAMLVSSPSRSASPCTYKTHLRISPESESKLPFRYIVRNT